MLNIKLLIGMLYCGENEKESSIESLKQQKFKNWDFFIIKNKPNKQAHDLLYKTFMSKNKEYTHFLKLDADMVFSNSDVLGDIMDNFTKNSKLDCLMIDVLDFYSGIFIPGQQTFSNIVQWEGSDDIYNVDYPPITPNQRERLVFKKPLIYHSPNPSNLQAFYYGVHKTIKMIQQDSKKKSSSKSFLMWTIITNVWEHYKKIKDIRLLYMLSGVEFVYSLNQETLKMFKNTYIDKRFQDYFEKEILPKKEEELYNSLYSHWGYPILNSTRWFEKIFF